MQKAPFFKIIVKKERNMTVDVIIPTYKPDQRFFELIALLDKQTFPISHIRIINTEEKYFEKIIYGRRYEEEYRNLCVTHISRSEIDHHP